MSFNPLEHRGIPLAEQLRPFNECWLYYSFLQQESDRRVKAIWELHLDMELGQLHEACELMRTHDGRDPVEMLPAELPEAMTFEPNKQYVRQLLADQVDLTTLGTGFVRDAHERFKAWQGRRTAGQRPGHRHAPVDVREQ